MITTNFGLGKGIRLTFVGGLVVVAASSCQPKSTADKLAEVEDRLAIMSDFEDMPRVDVALALHYSLQCLEENPNDVECVGSAVHWYRALGADDEARALIKSAPSAIKSSNDWPRLSSYEPLPKTQE